MSLISPTPGSEAIPSNAPSGIDSLTPNTGIPIPTSGGNTTADGPGSDTATGPSIGGTVRLSYSPSDIGASTNQPLYNPKFGG